jgi:hypothetical protein
VCVPAVHLCHTTHCQGRQRSCTRRTRQRRQSHRSGTAPWLRAGGLVVGGGPAGCGRSRSSQVQPGSSQVQSGSSQVQPGPARRFHLCAVRLGGNLKRYYYYALTARLEPRGLSRRRAGCLSSWRAFARLTRAPTARQARQWRATRNAQCTAQRCTVPHGAAQCTALHSASVHSSALHSAAAQQPHGASRQVEPGPRGESGETARRRESGETARRDCAAARGEQCSALCSRSSAHCCTRCCTVHGPRGCPVQCTQQLASFCWFI